MANPIFQAQYTKVTVQSDGVLTEKQITLRLNTGRNYLMLLHKIYRR